jgi:solute carrier family 35, member C2
MKLTSIIASITVGVMMMAAGETSFNVIGFSLVIASAFFSGLRWTLTQFVMLHQPAASNPFSTLFLLSPIMFVSLATIALAVEGPANILDGFRALSAAHGAVTGASLLIFPGILAFGMVSAQFALLRRASVVTLNICGILKELVTITGARIVFHDKLSFINVSGVVITIGSIACYNYINLAKMRREVRTQILQREHTTGTADYIDIPSKVH